MPRRFFTRHETRRIDGISQVKSGVGAALAIAAVGWMAAATHAPLLIAPFGATAVLVFGQPASPLAQPANVVGGYLVSALIALAAAAAFPASWWAAGLAVGCAIILMLGLRLTHPPAGALPLISVGGVGLTPTQLVAVSVGGALAITLYGALHHWLPPRLEYPKKPA